MIITTFRRREKKFLLNREQTKFLMQGIVPYTEPDSYSRSENGYRICSLYFDTPDNWIIQRSLQKPPYKEKLRLRSYGTANEHTPVFFELKKKFKGEGVKRRVVLPLGEIQRFWTTGQLPENLSYMNRQVLNEIEYFRQLHPNLSPVIYIGCDRRAFFAKNNPELRITFDRNILTRREKVNLTDGHFGTPLLEEGQQLMEVKVSDAFPLWLANLLSQAQAYTTGFSKYGKEYERMISHV
mgnify:CR=1 FL=1